MREGRGGGGFKHAFFFFFLIVNFLEDYDITYEMLSG